MLKLDEENLIFEKLMKKVHQAEFCLLKILQYQNLNDLRVYQVENVTVNECMFEAK